MQTTHRVNRLNRSALSWSRGRAAPLIPLVIGVLLANVAHSDWTRFRGPDGAGLPLDGKSVPTEWSDSKNLKWKTELPGPGSSCPIITGDKVLVTYWSGYGTDGPDSGKMEELKRHLACYNRANGQLIWDRSVSAKLPETAYNGMMAQHGYASHTPVTDGKHVYAFFGKSGVHAFDLAGEPLWNVDVGDGLDERKWGSAASPVLAGETLVVLASPESKTLFGLDKNTGAVKWKLEDDNLAGIWSTPVAVSSGDQVIVRLAKELWAVDATRGEVAWKAPAGNARSATGSPVVHDGVVYGMGSRGGGSFAIRATGDPDDRTVWTGRDGASISSPVHWEGHLYWINGSLANCRNAETGEEVYSERIPGMEAGSQGGGGGGDRNARFASMDYSSPVAAGGYLYHITRKGDGLVVKLGPKFELTARNKFASDDGDFSATPALSDGQLFLRSSKNLYCVAE